MKLRTLYIVLITLLLVASMLSLIVSDVSHTVQFSFLELLKESGMANTILLELRLPRLLVTLLTGASLGMAGAALQGYLRNPLAEPSLLGISNGAALGAVVLFYSGLAYSSMLWLPVAGIASACATGVLLYAFSGRSGHSITIILAGVALSSLMGALIAVILNIVPNPYAALEIVHWLMGSASNVSMQQVGVILPFVLLGWCLLLSSGKALEALSLGEDVAVSMGISLRKTQLLVIAGTACCVGACVSVTGSIGFIGLIVPHLLRRHVSYSPFRLLWASAIGGALLLTLADITVRLIPTSGAELKLGVVTALIGVPFFFHLIRQSARGES
jgi:iron complex transport system permease protein